MLRYNSALACGGPCPPEGPCDNCLSDWNSDIYGSQSFWDKILEFLGPVGIYILIGTVISFFITLGFYFVYKHKKDEHSWKHAFNRSGFWWIVIFLLVPLVIFLVSWLKFIIEN